MVIIYVHATVRVRLYELWHERTEFHNYNYDSSEVSVGLNYVLEIPRIANNKKKNKNDA